MRVVATDDKRRQVARGVIGVYEERSGYKRRGQTMRVTGPGEETASRQ